MSIALVRLILYVHDVAAVKAFYQTHFALSVIGRSPGVGGARSRRHRAGAAPGWRGLPTAAGYACTRQRSDHGKHRHQLVFAITTDLPAHRQQLQHAGVPVGELKRYAGFA